MRTKNLSFALQFFLLTITLVRLIKEKIVVFLNSTEFKNTILTLGILSIFVWCYTLLCLLLALGTDDSWGDFFPMIIIFFKTTPVIATIVAIITLALAWFCLDQFDKKL